jgi:ABC-type taurine transport system ATPase subunit
MVRLSLEQVTYGQSLRWASVVVRAGEIISVRGSRDDRSTLLCVAAGLYKPKTGVVFVNGRMVFVQQSWPAMGGVSVMSQLTLALLSRMSLRQARSLALDALCNWGVERWDTCDLNELEDWELTKLSLIRALVVAPDLLLYDYGAPARPSEIEQMLRVARNDGVGVLLTSRDVIMGNVDGLYEINNGSILGPLWTAPDSN